MLEEIGIVIEVREHSAVVEMARRPTCSHCGLCKLGAQEKMQVEAENAVGARVNDRVKVSVPSPVILKSAFIVYMVPLIALFTGFFAGTYVLGEKGGVVVGISSALGVIIGLHFYDKRLKRKQRTLVRISEILR